MATGESIRQAYTLESSRTWKQRQQDLPPDHQVFLTLGKLENEPESDRVWQHPEPKSWTRRSFARARKGSGAVLPLDPPRTPFPTTVEPVNSTFRHDGSRMRLFFPPHGSELGNGVMD